jgi:hypothetical protein
VLGKDQWPLAATIKALFADARQRSREYSEAKAHYETIKAEREKLTLMKENEAWTAVIGYMLAGIVASRSSIFSCGRQRGVLSELGSPRKSNHDARATPYCVTSAAPRLWCASA